MNANKPTKSFDSFVTDLKILKKDCGYQEEERMVCDTIVFPCKHTKVREKCLNLADELTLEKAVEIGCNHETNLNSLKKLTKDEDPTVNIVNKQRSQTTLRLMERRREPLRLSKIYGERTVTNIWPCLTIGLHHYQASNCRQQNC